MANEREYGYNTGLLLERESSYGGGGSGNFNSVFFDECTLKANRPLEKSDRAGAGRETTEIFQGPVSCEGNVIVPLEMRDVGLWLTGLLGNPTTTGSGPYTHTFVSGGADLPSFESEKQFPSVPLYENFTGLKVNSMGFNSRRSGPMQLDFGVIAQTMTPGTSSGGGTPTSNTLVRASGLQGVLKLDDANIANLTGLDFIFSNNLNRIDDTHNQTDGALEGLDEGETSCEGNINVRFHDDVYYDAARGKTALDLQIVYTLSGSLSLTTNIHEIYLEQTGPEIRGAGGVSVPFRFMAKKNTSAGETLEAILVNDLAGTFYTI